MEYWQLSSSGFFSSKLKYIRIVVGDPVKNPYKNLVLTREASFSSNIPGTSLFSA